MCASGVENLVGRLWPSGTSRSANDHAALEAQLTSLLEEAQRRWPGLTLPVEEFVTRLGERLSAASEPRAALAELQVADLYLAVAVVRRDRKALVHFETLLARTGQFVARVTRDADEVAEIQQRLRVKLLVGEDGKGRLTQYSGRGALESWICAAALHIAYDLTRAQARRPLADDGALGELAAQGDVELDLLRQQYREQFRTALSAALTGLTARQRTLLRLYYLERLTAAEVGQLYRVHESTVVRWLAQARNEVVTTVRTTMKRELALSTHEWNELAGLVHSQLELSLRRLLAQSQAS